ncbi:MAG TPA: AI-2E family transporter [Kofleriaceae bacterium]|nr:AI-2E family transporter [Kofleriaceae bacterium]
MSDAQSQRSEEERHILGMVRWLLYLVFVVVAYLILRKLGPILSPVLAAAGVAYLLDRLVDRLAARGMNRTLAVVLLLGGFVALVVALMVVVLPQISQELARFARALPGLVERATAWLASDYGIEVPSDWKESLKGPEVRSFLERAAGPLSVAAAAAVGGFLGFLGFLAELLLVPVFAFYFLVDWDGIVRRVHAMVPPRHRAHVADVAREIDTAVSAWIRGQFIVMAILAALYAVAFKIIGLHLGITIGIITGLMTVIPVVGVLTGAGLAFLVLMLDWHGPGPVMATAGVFLVLNVVEGFILTPRLVGKRVGLGEVGALFAVLAGGQLLGFTGVLLAVPIAASVAVLVRRAMRYYEGSSFFNEGSELAVAAAAPRKTRPIDVVRPVLDPMAPAPEPEPEPDPEEKS